MDVSTKTILIVEDEFLIAMDLQMMIEEAGFLDSKVTSSCAEARAWLKRSRPSVVILDTRLRDGSSATIAANLVEQSIPFIVSSGAPKDTVDPIFHQGIWLGKPCHNEVLGTTLRELLA